MITIITHEHMAAATTIHTGRERDVRETDTKAERGTYIYIYHAVFQPFLLAC